MRGVIRIAFRNTRRQLKRAVLLGGAIAFGVMIITLLNAFTSGAVGNIKENFSYAMGGHIFVNGAELTETGREVSLIGDDEVLRSAVDEADPRIKSIHRRSGVSATLIFGSRTATQWIDGVDYSVETELARGLQLREGTLDDFSDPQGLILPAPVAERLGVEAGESVLVRLMTVTGQQNVGEFRVTAIIEDTAGFGMTSAYTSIEYLNSLIGLDAKEYQWFSVFLYDLKDIDAVANDIYQAIVNAGSPAERPLADVSSIAEYEEQSMEAFGQMFGAVAEVIAKEPWEGTKFSVTTLNEMMQPVVAAMSILDGIALGIFVILLLITGVGILNTFRMIIIERTREIGTMRAFGMQRKTVRCIFLWEAAIISLGGGVVGLALAGIIAAIVSRFTFSDAQGLEFFMDGGHITFLVTPGDLVGNLAIVLAMSLLAALLPANAAARLKPVKALGSHY